MKSSSCFQQDSCENTTLQTAVCSKEDFQKGIAKTRQVVSYGKNSYIWITQELDATQYVAESEASDAKLPELIAHRHMKLLCHIGKHLSEGMYVFTHTTQGFIKTPCTIGRCNRTLWENKPNYIHKEYNGLSVFVHQSYWKNHPIYIIEPPHAAEGISANALNLLYDLMEMHHQGIFNSRCPDNSKKRKRLVQGVHFEQHDQYLAPLKRDFQDLRSIVPPEDQDLVPLKHKMRPIIPQDDQDLVPLTAFNNPRGSSRK